jgi:type III secretion protein J
MRNPRRHRTPGLAAIAALLLVLLSGCKQEVYTKLTESDANEMLAVLLPAHLDATKDSPDGKTWNVMVESSQMGTALGLLHANGLPAEHRASLGDMFKKDGLISTPTEERVRFIYGVSQELERTLASIDGVIVARVHVVLPNNDPLAEHVRPSSASVFIKYRSDVNIATLIPTVKNLVVRSVEGLSYENVNVTLAAAVAPPAESLAQPTNASMTFVLGLLLVLTAATLGGGYFFWTRSRKASTPTAAAGAVAPEAA